MKKYWLPPVFALFLLLTPAAFASDGNDSPGFFADLLQQIVALFVGDEVTAPANSDPSAQGATNPGDEPELGCSYPPHG